MVWLFLALLTAFLRAVANTIDKIVLSKYVPSSVSYLIYGGLYGGISAIFLYFFHGVQRTNMAVTMLLFAHGLTFLGFLIFYFQAIRYTSPFVAVGVTFIEPILAIFWGLALFNESLAIMNYLGVLVILVSIFAIVRGELRTEHKIEKSHARQAIMFALASTVFYSLSNVILRAASQYTDIYTTFFWSRVGGLIATLGLLFVRPIRNGFMQILKSVGTINIVIFIVELIGLAEIFTTTSAYATGYLALVSAALAIQPLFTLILSAIVGRSGEKGLMSMKYTARSVAINAIISLAIAIGVYMLTV